MRRRIMPGRQHFVLSLPDMSAAFVARHALRGKHAVLARIRHNRLLDLFLGVAAYSAQHHLRVHPTRDRDWSCDEMYFAVGPTGRRFVIPVQAKGGNDQVGVVQVTQDLALCRKAFPNLTPRAVAVQSVADPDGEVIVMFELAESEGDIRVVDEKHYRLVPASQITADDLQLARDL